MATLFIDGRSSDLGERVALRAQTDPDVDAVTGHLPDSPVADGHPSPPGGLDVVILAAEGGPERDGSGTGGVALDMAAAVLADLDARVAAGLELRGVVVLSSAMVYGAWPDNPVPLTEDAVLRPNPTSGFAVAKAELERLAGEFARAHPEVPVAVLRPPVTTSSDPSALQWMGWSLWHAATARHGDGDPPLQFLHVDDLAGAIDHVRRHRSSGVFNVAPEGWLTSERQIELVGRGGRVRIPSPVAGRVARWRWNVGLTSTPPEVLPFTMHPWVVASDRLRATGWEPVSSNAEAFVVGSRPGWWASLSARRRQEASLGALVLAVAAVVATVVVLVRRRRRG